MKKHLVFGVAIGLLSLGPLECRAQVDNPEYGVAPAQPSAGDSLGNGILPPLPYSAISGGLRVEADERAQERGQASRRLIPARYSTCLSGLRALYRQKSTEPTFLETSVGLVVEEHRADRNRPRQLSIYFGAGGTTVDGRSCTHRTEATLDAGVSQVMRGAFSLFGSSPAGERAKVADAFKACESLSDTLRATSQELLRQSRPAPADRSTGTSGNGAPVAP